MNKYMYDLIFQQIKIAYHTQETINSLENIGLNVYGDCENNLKKDNNIGNHLYATLSAACDSIITIYKSTNENNHVYEYDFTDKCQKHIDDLLSELQKSHDLSYDNILNLYKQHFDRIND